MKKIMVVVGSVRKARAADKILDIVKAELKNYPDVEAMGKLTFDLIEIKTLSPQNYFVVGKWMLAKKVGDFSGYYTLLIRKIKGQWKIVADHSS